MPADESALTGEAFPVPKTLLASLPSASAHARIDSEHWGLAGTRVLTGQAQLCVLRTVIEGSAPTLAALPWTWPSATFD